MTVMAADVNEAPKGEDPSGQRGRDRKEEKEPAPMTVEGRGGGGTIVSSSSSAAGQGTTQKGETKEGKGEDEEEEGEEAALLEMLNRAAATTTEEAVAKAIAEAEERHRVDKESFARRMEAEWRERVHDEKARKGEAAEKQSLSFEKE